VDYLLHHLFLTSLECTPTKEAVADKQITLTYHQLAERTGYVATKLLEVGVNRGDRIAFFLDHNVEQAIAILAISAVGAVFVPINSVLFPEQVIHIIKDSGARLLLTTKKKGRALAGMLENCPDLMEIWLVEDLKGSKTIERFCYSIEMDLAAILYTSGSTGSPKGVMISHRNLLSGCSIVSDYLQLDSSDYLLGVLPLSFDYGLNQLITMLALGGSYRFFSFNIPNEIVNALVKYKITGLAGVPPMWALLARSSLGRTPLPYLRRITNSGGVVPANVLEKLRKMLPETKIFLMYGLTEAFRSTYLPPAEFALRPSSMGKAIPNTEILVVSDSGRLCGANEVGELVHRGPTVSMGYWQRPEETAKIFRPHPIQCPEKDDNEHVLYSGDLVKFDEEGFFYFEGRRDAMIKCSGYRISPNEIEEIVFKSDLIKEAAAVGVNDVSMGQKIIVFVVPIGSENIDADFLPSKIIDFCTEFLPSYMVPRKVEIVESIPKTASGKVDYVSLKMRS